MAPSTLVGADHVPRPPRRRHRRHTRLDAAIQGAMTRSRGQLRQHVLGLRDIHARLVARHVSRAQGGQGAHQRHDPKYNGR